MNEHKNEWRKHFIWSKNLIKWYKWENNKDEIKSAVSKKKNTIEKFTNKIEQFEDKNLKNIKWDRWIKYININKIK